MVSLLNPLPSTEAFNRQTSEFSANTLKPCFGWARHLVMIRQSVRKTRAEGRREPSAFECVHLAIEVEQTCAGSQNGDSEKDDALSRAKMLTLHWGKTWNN